MLTHHEYTYNNLEHPELKPNTKTQNQYVDIDENHIETSIYFTFAKTCNNLNGC